MKDQLTIAGPEVVADSDMSHVKPETATPPAPPVAVWLKFWMPFLIPLTAIGMFALGKSNQVQANAAATQANAAAVQEISKNLREKEKETDKDFRDLREAQQHDRTDIQVLTKMLETIGEDVKEIRKSRRRAR